MAETAVEKMFLLDLFEVDSIWSPVYSCMLGPVSPPPPRFLSSLHKFPKVATLQPTLEWEHFPRERDKQADRKGFLNKVGNITYELKVWKGTNGAPEELVYGRHGLTAPKHTLETTLEPSTEYFWTVRAVFDFGGLPGITKWSHSRVPWPPGFADPCLENTIPLYHYYRFLTPPQRKG